MPTSSQSLILQTTNGQLPPFFGRRPWRPELPPGPEWTSSEYPMSTVQIKHDYTGSEIKRYKSNRKPQSLKRAGSAPELSYKVNFSTLPQLLKIRGLHGTVRYDTDTKYVAWKVNSIGPFYDRMNARGRSMMASDMAPGTLRYFHADRAGPSIYAQDADVLEHAYHPEFRKRVQFQDPVTFGKESHPDIENSAKEVMFMTTEETEGGVQMIRTGLEAADYFKLIQVRNQPDEANRGEGVELPVFRLQKCHPTEVGCFRLAPTDVREVGDYKLVPPPGYLADDFRLVPSSEMQGAFTLLQSDAVNPGQYHPVLRNKDASGEFRMIQAKVQKTSPEQDKMDIIVPREAWGESNSYLELQSQYEYKAVRRLQNKDNRVQASDNRFNYFDDVRNQNGDIEKEYTLPDISLYESHGKGVLHHQPQTAHSTYRASTFDNDLMTFNQHLEEFNQRYMATLKQDSSRGYKRPVHLGVRNVKGDCEEQTKAANCTGSSTQLLGSDWKTHNFDQWSRTTKNCLVEPLPSANVSQIRNVQKMPPISFDQKEAFEEKGALLDDVKFKANYKLWKKKKVATVRMRKDLPPSDPTAVCIRFDDTNLSHDELKATIEKEIGHTLVSLQFDPVSVHSADPEATSRWIVRFSEATVCENMVENGIRINGMKNRVRRFDDVMKEEYEAYKFYKMVKDYTDKKPQRNSSLRKANQKQKILKTTQTQTNKQEIL